MSQTFLVFCLCLIYSDPFVFFNPVPFAIFDSREVKNLIYFPPQCHALSLPSVSSCTFSLFFFSSFPINLLPLSVTVVSCALWIFSLFSFDPPWQNNIICQNRSVSGLSLLSLTHKRAAYTHTHKCTYTKTYSDSNTDTKFAFPQVACFTHALTHFPSCTPCILWYTNTHQASQALQGEACHGVIYVSLPFQSMIKALNRVRGVAPLPWYLINFVSHVISKTAVLCVTVWHNGILI